MNSAEKRSKATATDRVAVEAGLAGTRWPAMSQSNSMFRLENAEIASALVNIARAIGAASASFNLSEDLEEALANVDKLG
jgi:hypothetical protein